MADRLNGMSANLLMLIQGVSDPSIKHT